MEAIRARISFVKNHPVVSTVGQESNELDVSVYFLEQTRIGGVGK
jgi:hypothetical protein